MAGGGDGLAEADGEVVRVGELLIDRQRKQVGGDPGEVLRRHLKFLGQVHRAGVLRVDAASLLGPLLVSSTIEWLA